MAEILFCASDRGIGDDNHRKGEVVYIAPDGWQWGAAEVAPDFVRINVPGLNPATIIDRLEEWRHALNFQVVSSDIPTDTFRIRASNARISSVAGTTLGHVTRQQVENFLTRWNAAVVAEGANFVDFDIRILDALRSSGWWDRAGTPQVSEDAYDPATGVHTLTVQAPGYTARQIRNYLEDRGAVVLVVQDGQATYSTNRARVRQEFQEEIAERMARRFIRRRRFYLDSARVDQILANGGVMNYTATQLQNRVRDRLAE